MIRRVRLSAVVKHQPEDDVECRRPTAVTAGVPVERLTVASTPSVLCSAWPHALRGECATHPRQHQLFVDLGRVVQDEVVRADHVLEVVVLLLRVEVLEHGRVRQRRRRLPRLDGPRCDAGAARLLQHTRDVVGDEALGAVSPDHRPVVIEGHLTTHSITDDRSVIECHLTTHSITDDRSVIECHLTTTALQMTDQSLSAI